MFKQTLVMFALISGSAYAGDNGGGSLKCKSESGRTTVEGMAGVDWNGSGPASLVYTIDGKALSFNPSKPLATETHLVDYVVYSNKTSYTVGFKRSAFYAGAKNDPAFVYSNTLFELRSLPGTFRQVERDVYSFTAVIPEYSSLDPRKVSDLNADYPEKFEQSIQVNCLLDLRI